MAQGVPVFLADVKGDLSGLAAPGQSNDKIRSRASEAHQRWRWTATGFPAEFHALGGIGRGIPVRATVTSFGPVLLARVLQLNRTQEQSLGLISFLDSTTQTVRLIRSKGVGVFFVTQTPKDVPAEVLGQPGNRVQHALSGMFKTLARSVGTRIGREITRSVFGTARRRR